MLIADRVPTHILTGFLGAGKTTLLRHLLAQKPANEVWAVLVNEFGQIGLDGVLLDTGDDTGIAIKEVSGGCLCCTSQLPMQVGLSRLLSQAKPQRLFIEPTGLGHPLQLLEQLTEPHWAQALDLRAVITVLDGTRLHDTRLTTHESFVAQVQLADMLLLSHHAEMQAADHQQLTTLLEQWPSATRQIVPVDHGKVEMALIDQPRAVRRQTRRSLLHISPALSTQSATSVDADMPSTQLSLPYHYVERGLGQEVGGWRLPVDWVFDRDQLLLWLMSLQDWLRIKGVVQTEAGWLSINLIPNHIGFTSHQGGLDNRLEIINAPDADWASREAGLLACLHAGSANILVE